MKKRVIFCATAITTALMLGACNKSSEVAPEDTTIQEKPSVTLAGDELKKSEASSDDEVITSLDENSTLKKNNDDDSDKIVTTDDGEGKSDKDEKKSKSDDDKKDKSDKDEKKSKSDDDKKVATAKTSAEKAEEAQRKAITKRFNAMSKKEQEQAVHDETKTYVPENVQHFGSNIDMSTKVRSTDTLNDKIKVGMSLDDYNKAATEMQTKIDDYIMLGQEKSLLLIKATDGASVLTLNNNSNKISKIKNFRNTADAKAYIKKLKS